MYKLCEPGTRSVKLALIQTLLPRWVKEMTPRTVLLFLGSRRATPIGPASGTILGIESQAARSAAPSSRETETEAGRSLPDRPVAVRHAAVRLAPARERAVRVGVR